MLDQNDILKIKEAIEEFFQKTTIQITNANVSISFVGGKENPAVAEEKQITDVVDLDIKLDEPQILIGEKGQTLFEIQRLLRAVLNKKMQKLFYLNLDINDYKKKKIEYLKEFAKDLADEVAFTKKEKELSPMSSYERRAIHAELAQRQDVVTESQGEGQERHIVIKPKQ